MNFIFSDIVVVNDCCSFKSGLMPNVFIINPFTRFKLAIYILQNIFMDYKYNCHMDEL